MLAVAVSCSPVIFVIVITLSTVAVNGLPLEDDSDPEKIEARRTLVLSLSGAGVKHEHDQPADRKRNLQTPLASRGGGDHEEKEEKEKEVVEEEKGEAKNREESKSRVLGNDRYKSVDRRSRSKSTTTTTTTTERGVVEEEEEEEEVKGKVDEVKEDEKVVADKSCQNSENCTKVDRARKVTPSPAAIMSRRQRISNYHSSTTTDSSISTPTPSDQDVNSSTAVKKRRRLTTVSTTPTPPTTSAPFPTFNQYPAIEEVPQYDITQFLNFGKKISPETVPTPSGINSIESNKSIRQRTGDRHVSTAEKLSYLTPEEDIVNENMDVTVMKKAIERNTAPRGRIPVRDPVISSSYYRRRPTTSSTTSASVQTTDENLISTTECAAVDSSNTPTKVYRRRSPNFHSATIKTCGEVSGKKVENEKENRTEDVVEKKEVVSVSNRTEEDVDKVKAKPEVKITDVELVNRRRILKTSANSNRNKFERLQIPRSSSPVALVASPSMPPVVSTSSPSPFTTVLSAVTESKPQESSTTSSPATHPSVTDRVMKFRRPSTLPPSTTTPKPSETPKNVSADSHPEHSVDPLQQEESNPYPRNAKPSEAEPPQQQSVPQSPISPQPTTRILSTAVVTSVSVKESEQNNTRSTNKTVNVPQQSEPIALINENQNRSSFVDLSRSRINANVRTNNQTGADLNAIRSRNAVLRSNSSSNVQTTSTTEFPQNHKKVEEVEEKQDTVVKEVVDQNVNRYPSVNITRTPDSPSTTTASPTTSPSTTTTTSEPLPTTFRVGIFPSSPVTTVEHSTVASHGDSDMHNRSIISLSSINNNNTSNNRVASESSFADTKDSKFNAPPVEVAPERGSEVATEEEVETSVVNNGKIEDSYNPNLPGNMEDGPGSHPNDVGIHSEVSNSAPSGYDDQTNDQTFMIPKLHEDHVTKEPPPNNIYETGGEADNEPIPDGGPNPNYNDYDEDHVSNVPNNTRPPILNHNHNIKWTSSTAGGQFGSTKPAPSHNETPLVDVSSYPENLSITTYLVSALVVIPILLLSILAARIIILRSRRKKVLDDSEYSSEYNRSPLSTTTPSLHTKLPRLATHPSWEIEKNRELPPIPTNPVTRWEFPREKLRLQTVLGQGNFGQVWKAEADDINGHEGLTRLVAVKTVKEGASLQMREDLLRELGIMQELGAHPNVVTLLGCCTEKEPYLLIMEYVMYGKLLAFLRDHRTRAHYYNFSDATDALTSRDLTVFAYCVARGMDYLTSKSIIHRDLAARNVLVDHNKLCKIADFGMSRNVRDTGQIYEQRQCKGALPIRWMAPESLHFSLYTHKTDVWSFGILMWEIVTLGSTPYASMGAREVMRRVRGGYRLDRPTHCHQTLFRVIGRCWHSEPAKRPTFAELKQQLGDLLADEEHNGNYVDLESLADEMRQTSQSSNSSASTLQRP
ncbi:serine/threonine-protein kinase STE20-like [Nilaparvata lugens]|uniref:serine/threonine-protein kinase STE20-like n=1 Tax=Nilaparvata lugens TaxID=108931 RepID=UPI00193D91C9|nr:serine/threonine-protein kinase STE20-like [Nilaparvata lugens]